LPKYRITSPTAGQSGSVPQEIQDMLDESAKERVIDKSKVREMRHEAGVSYFDFTPVMLVSGALIVSMRYVAMGLGDKMLYIMAGISVRRCSYRSASSYSKASPGSKNEAQTQPRRRKCHGELWPVFGQPSNRMGHRFRWP
jgi:hypothetical protein